MKWTAIFFDVTGRINRGTYWFAQLIWGVAFVLLTCVGLWIADWNMTATQDRLFYIFSVPVIFGLAYSICVIAIKRFHDRDKSGWWIVPLILIPSPPGDIVEQITGKPYGFIWSIVSGLILTWTWVELGLLAGTATQNRFGDAPTPSRAWSEQ
jgi:uncharacterized membrane protein YhaH (DUF805 family)